MRRPGIEPGSRAWEARILTTRPPAHHKFYDIVFINSFVAGINSI